MKKTVTAILCLLMILTSGCSSAPAEPTVDYSESWRDRPIPESFDLRSVDTDGDGEGDRCFVTPVRFQNPFGTCWGFAAIAAAEISILGNNLKNDKDAWKTLDLSEKQLAYFTNVPLNDPANPQNGEGFTPKDITDSSQVYDKGGSGFLASSTFAQGIGPSYENGEDYGDWFTYRGKNHLSDQRYFDGKFQNYSYSSQDDWTIPEELRFSRDFRLMYSHMLPSPAQINLIGSYIYYRDATNMIKEELLEKRGVLIGFCADTSLPTQDSSEGIFIELNNWAHYTWAENARPNHAVTIIGWDDNYPRENFLKDHMPPENGAWLVKNSWGSGELEFPASGNRHWGIEVPETDEKGNPVLDENGNPVMVGSGYFWLSYFDKSLSTPETFMFATVEETEHIHQHDYLSASGIYVSDFYDVARMANVFSSEHAEKIHEISCITERDNTTVEYQVYILNDDFTEPDQGYLVSEGTEVFEFGGFHRIPLDKDVYLQKGQHYSVVMSLYSGISGYYVNTPIGLSLKGMNDLRAIINEKESFIFAEGEWFDYKRIAEEDWAEEQYEAFGGKLYYDNFPIKAYTTYLENDMNIILTPTENVISSREGKNTCDVGLLFRGNSSSQIGNPEISWQLLPGSEEFLGMSVYPSGNAVSVTGKKSGEGYVSATVDGIGTAIVKITVREAVPVRYLPTVSSMVYTGEELRCEMMVLDENNARMKENEDYRLIFSSNTGCGIARVEIADRDGNSYEEPLYAYFAIKPAKAEITSVQAGPDSIVITVNDQWASGITGYQLEYRLKGENQWTVTEFTSSTQFTVSDLAEGEYEVRVRGFVDTSEMEKDSYCLNMYYGEYSDTVTVSLQ